MKAVWITGYAAALVAMTTSLAAQTATQPTVSGAVPVVGSKSHGDTAGNTGTTRSASGTKSGAVGTATKQGSMSDGSISMRGNAGSTNNGPGSMTGSASLKGSGNSVKKVPSGAGTTHNERDRSKATTDSAPAVGPGANSSVSPAAK